MEAFEHQFPAHVPKAVPPLGRTGERRFDQKKTWQTRELSQEASELLDTLSEEILDDQEFVLVERGIQDGFSSEDIRVLLIRIRPEVKRFLQKLLYPAILPKVDQEGKRIPGGDHEIALEAWAQEIQNANHPNPTLSRQLMKENILFLADALVADMRLVNTKNLTDYLFRVVTRGLTLPKK